MPRPKRYDSPVLQTLERHRAALLQEARVNQALSEALLGKAEAACAAAESHLASALSAQRTLGERDTVVAAYELQTAHHYARVQSAALSALQVARDRRQRDLATAQELLSVRLKDVKTIERLRERLRLAAAKWDLRQGQSKLDGLGIAKGASGEATWP
jgi:hypothetical protein